jgi:hypothetical protein
VKGKIVAMLVLIIIIIGAYAFFTGLKEDPVKLTVNNGSGSTITVTLTPMDRAEYDAFKAGVHLTDIRTFTVVSGSSVTIDLPSDTVTIIGTYGAFETAIGYGDGVDFNSIQDISGSLRSGDHVTVSVQNSWIFDPIEIERSG